jgi:SPP1 family predicted phage head-tail adaptor
MATFFLDAGRLDKRAAIEVNEPVADAMGGARDAWREVGETSVRVEPLRQTVEEITGQHIGTATHRVICRARGDLLRGMAFRLGERRRLVIRTLHDPDESGRFLICRCEEEA